MIVVVAGCSHIFGSDLDDVKYPNPSKSVWPHLVADKLDAKCINITRIAGGNQSIVRRTIITLHDLIENQKIDPKDILLLVQFSYWNRLELFHKEFQWCGAGLSACFSKVDGWTGGCGRFGACANKWSNALVGDC